MIKALKAPIATVVLFVVGVALLLGGTINGVQAAPNIVSSDYTAQVELVDISTELYENGKSVDSTLLADFKNPAIGKVYDEQLAVHNNGDIDEYVRVAVTKYWTDADGNKQTDLDPALIVLSKPGSGWTIDEKVSTDERVVMYYSKILPAAEGENVSSNFVDTFRLDPAVAKEAKKYEGMSFHIDAKVDAVQTHNGTDAMKGAWGRTNK